MAFNFDTADFEKTMEGKTICTRCKVDIHPEMIRAAVNDPSSGNAVRLIEFHVSGQCISQKLIPEKVSSAIHELETETALHITYLKHRPSVADPAGVARATLGFRDEAGNGLYFSLDHKNKFAEIVATVDGKKYTYCPETKLVPPDAE